MVRGIDIAAEARRASNSFSRATFVLAKAASVSMNSEDVAKRFYPNDEDTLKVVKAAISPGTSSSSGWASQLVQSSIGEFLTTLGVTSAAAALMSRGVQVKANAQVTLPKRSTAPAAPAWVSETSPIPVRKDVLDSIQLGPSKKLGSIVVMTRELMKASDAANVFNLLLREDVSKGLDSAVFSTEDGSGDAYKGLLNGVSATTGTGRLISDMQSLARAVSRNGSGQVAFISGAGVAAASNIDALINATILPSPAVAETRLIAVDPQSLIWGIGDDVEIDTSTEGVLHMSDDPLPLVANGVTADPTRSLYQTDCVATRILLPVAFEPRRAGAVAYIDNVDYGA